MRSARRDNRWSGRKTKSIKLHSTVVYSTSVFFLHADSAKHITANGFLAMSDCAAEHLTTAGSFQLFSAFASIFPKRPCDSDPEHMVAKGGRTVVRVTKAQHSHLPFQTGCVDGAIILKYEDTARCEHGCFRPFGPPMRLFLRSAVILSHDSRFHRD